MLELLDSGSSPLRGILKLYIYIYPNLEIRTNWEIYEKQEHCILGKSKGRTTDCIYFIKPLLFNKKQSFSFKKEFIWYCFF